jgi:hypothetical protein
MHPVLFFIRRAFYRLTLMLGIFCFIEVFMHSTEGTKPNYMFPWGHYVATLSVIGVCLLATAYFSKIGPYDRDLKGSAKPTAPTRQDESRPKS